MPDDPFDAVPAVYDALRRLAEQRLAGERVGHTLTATALVHDAYLRLSGDDPGRWRDAAHFYHAAAEAMRRVLIDHARTRLAEKRGGGRARVDLTESLSADVATLGGRGADPMDLLALDAALDRLAAVSPDAAAVVRLRFYAGLTVEQVADTLGRSVATVHRKWTYARLFLYRELSPSGEKC